MSSIRIIQNWSIKVRNWDTLVSVYTFLHITSALVAFLRFPTNVYEKKNRFFLFPSAFIGIYLSTQLSQLSPLRLSVPPFSSSLLLSPATSLPPALIRFYSAGFPPRDALLAQQPLGLWLFLTMRVARQSTTLRCRAILVQATGPNPHYPQNRPTPYTLSVLRVGGPPISQQFHPPYHFIRPCILFLSRDSFRIDSEGKEEELKSSILKDWERREGVIVTRKSNI